MKPTLKHFLHGGAFAGIANLAVLLLFTVSVIFPFDWLQQLAVICILFVPGIIYYIFANKRTVYFALGMLAGHIVVLDICFLLSHTFTDPFIAFIESLVFGESGLLFGIQFILEFFLRVIALTLPPIIHLIAHSVGWAKSKLKQRETEN